MSKLTADALDAGLHLSAFYSLAQVDAFARLATILVHFEAIVTIFVTIFHLTFKNCRIKCCLMKPG